MRSIVTIGGGTGQYTLLSGLKQYPVNLTAIVSMADDGGSTGVLRDELGVLPPGDIRQCLVALAESEPIVRELFNYRFDTGGLKGHSFGNLFLSTLEKITGNFEESVRVAGMVLATRGMVIPVTTQNTHLICEHGDKCLRGEHAVNSGSFGRDAELRLEPEAFANPKAVEAIESADCVVIGPGNIYCSILPNLLVKGIPEAIRRSKAKVVYNANLMTKIGHTEGFALKDFVEMIEDHLGKGRLDFVIANERVPDPELIERYADEGEPVSLEGVDEMGASIVRGDLISRTPHVQKPGDPLRRTLIRHDPRVLAQLIISNCLGGL